jgi:hypothetical protein
MRVLLTNAIVIVIAIARMAPSPARRSGICPVLIIIILEDYHIPILWSNSQEVAWLVLPAAWWLNHCPEIIATIPRETHASVFNIPELVVCGLERLGSSPKTLRCSHLQLFIWSQVLSNICPGYERKVAHNSRNTKFQLLRCGHMTWNCEKWRVATGSRKIIS